jgi:hypothetical protein
MRSSRHNAAQVRPSYWQGLCLMTVTLSVLLPVTGYTQYVVQSEVIAGGGARTTGGSYIIHQTTAQSGPIGVSSGGSYMAHHGFWYTLEGGGALAPMVLDIDRLNATTARLSWSAVTGATYYDLYRSPSAYFSAVGSPWQTVAHPTTYLDFTAGIGNTSTNYFFKGKARNASQTSPESNAVGEFDRDSASTSDDIPPQPVEHAIER